MTTTLQSFDVVIAGGGLSGALAAIGLAELYQPCGSKLNIAVIENNDIFEKPKTSFDDRVLALSHGSSCYLQSVNVWQHLIEHAEPIKNIHISDRGAYGKARIYAKDHNVEALGYVCEMSKIGQALIKQLSSFKNVTWFCPDSIAELTWHKEYVNIELASKSCLTAKLLLACDGAQSQCRAAANISTSIKAYEQSALIANLTMVKAHQNIAYERFTETGPIAMLPLPDSHNSSRKCSLVWTLTPELAQQMYDLNEQDFKQALITAFGSWLGDVEIVGKRFIYPLNLVQANEQVYHRMALVGNASHTIHPIAGQGFNLGLRDVSQLVSMLKDRIDAGLDIGNFAALSEYAEERAKDHNEVITLTDSLVTLFSNKHSPLVLGRTVALKVLNYASCLKNAFVNKTMGY